MRLYVGKVAARCMACGSEDWDLKAGAQFSVLSEVECAGCRTPSTYGDLALQTPLETEAGATGIELPGRIARP